MGTSPGPSYLSIWVLSVVHQARLFAVLPETRTKRSLLPDTMVVRVGVQRGYLRGLAGSGTVALHHQ